MAESQKKWVGDIPFFIEKPNVHLLSTLVADVSKCSGWSEGTAKAVSDSAVNAIHQGELLTTYPFENSGPSKKTIIPFVHIQDFSLWLRRTHSDLDYVPPTRERTRVHGEIEADNRNLILAVLYTSGFDPLNLVAGSGRKPGPKAFVRNALKVGQVGQRMSKSAFDKAWIELKEQKLIVQTVPEKK